MDYQARMEPGFDFIRAVWSRRKWLAVLVFTWALAAVVGVAQSLPDIYRGTATVLVESQQVQEAVVRPAVMSRLETRLQTITQVILSRSRLEELINRLGLYPDLKKRASSEALVQQLRRDIQLERKEADQTGERGETIAFTLSYRGKDPDTVARVTNALASSYVEENTKMQERAATGTAELLAAQLKEMQKRVDRQEGRIGMFKARYTGELPQQVTVNLSSLTRLNEQLRLNSDKQIRAMDRREALVRQAADAGGVGSMSTPDVTTARIAKLNQELGELRTRFTDRYPDVMRIKMEIATLDDQLARTKLEGGVESGAPPRADSSPSPGLADAMGKVDAEIRALRNEEKALRQSVAIYERRVENAPRREQELQELQRDYGSTKEIYSALLKRYQEVQLTENMEQSQQGEQFRILDAALPPRRPVAPSRFGLLFMGLIFSLGMAIGAVVFAEKRDTSFHSMDDLRTFTKVPVLVSIPRIVTKADVRRRRWQFCAGVAAALLGLALVVAVSYFLTHGNVELVRLLARGRL